MDISDTLRTAVAADLANHWQRVQQAKSYRMPAVDEGFPELLGRTFGWAGLELPRPFQRELDDLLTSIHPMHGMHRLEEYCTEQEKGFFTHDVAHISHDTGILSLEDLGRESSESILRELGDIPPMPTPVVKKNNYGRWNMDGVGYGSEQRTRRIAANKLHRIQRDTIFRSLHDPETVREALSAWQDSFVNSLDSRYFLAAYVPDRYNIPTGTFELSQIAQAAQEHLNNAFFGFTRANRSHRIDIEVEGGQGLYTDKSGLVFSWVYNLAKNAMKWAEDLYVKHRDFQGGSVKISIDEDRENIYISVGQTFEGPDLQQTAAMGYEIVQSHPELAKQLDSASVKRYKRWIGSKHGEGVNDITIRDITDVLFLERVSGGHISSKTSGLGLYAARTLAKERGGKIEYFLNATEERGYKGEGFVMALPKTAFMANRIAT